MITLACQHSYCTAPYLFYFLKTTACEQKHRLNNVSVSNVWYNIQSSTPLITAPNREISGGLDSTAVTPQYKRGGCPIPSNMPECSDSYELETLMPPGSQESGQPPAEAPEEQSLMASANPGEGEDVEPKV